MRLAETKNAFETRGIRRMEAKSHPAPKPGPELASLRIHRDPERVKRPTGWLLAGSIVAVALAVAAYFAAASFLGAVPVEKTTAALVTPGQVLTILTVSGYVEAETRADLSPKITSRITDLRVTEGTRVRKGEIIARLDHTDLDAQLADAEAGWRNARADLQRKTALHREGLATQSDLDAAVAAESSTGAKVSYVKALLDYTVLRAPFDGVVVAKRAHVGEAVSPYGSPGQGSSSGGAIVTLVDFSTLYVGADVNESNLARLGDRQPAQIVLDAYPDHEYQGWLKQIIPSADRQKGTVKVKVAFQSLDDRILPDLSARVNFTAEAIAGTEKKSSVQVPRSTVVTRQGQSGVFLIQEDRVRFRPVTLGREQEGIVEIREGLSGGEALVAGASKLDLSDGQRVRIKEQP
jgi:HlyD family secretion protein